MSIMSTVPVIKYPHVLQGSHIHGKPKEVMKFLNLIFEVWRRVLVNHLKFWKNHGINRDS